MKVRIFTLLTMLLVLAGAILGITKRQSYTDFSKDKDYLERVQVAELPEQLAVSSCSELSQALPSADIIMRVLVRGDIEHLFRASRQRVQVQEVYAGRGVKAGGEIYLTSDRWSLVIDGAPNSIERGFVNIMNVGDEYLVFISQQINVPNEQTPIYSLYDKTYISPVFPYAAHENIIVSAYGESTYVPYIQVKDNDFFATSEEGLRAWESLKAEMLSAYPN